MEKSVPYPYNRYYKTWDEYMDDKVEYQKPEYRDREGSLDDVPETDDDQSEDSP